MVINQVRIRYRKGLPLFFGMVLCTVMVGCGEKEAAVEPPAPTTASSEPTAEEKKKPAESKPTKTKPDVPDLAGLIELVEPAVVHLEVATTAGVVHGSGFIISSDGLVITNQQVVVNARSAVVKFRNGAEINVAGTVLLDEERDIAVLKVIAPGTLPMLSLTKEVPLKDESVVAFGATKSLLFSAKEGIVSAVRKSKELDKEGKSVSGTWIQTTTTIFSENNGGPLVNRKGEVVGMNTLISASGRNMNFAVSASHIRDLLKKAEANPKVIAFSSPSSPAKKKTEIAETSESDGSKKEESTSPSARFLKKISNEMKSRIREINSFKSDIEKQREKLKQALLNSDEEAETAANSQILQSKKGIDGLITRPFAINTIDLWKPTTGDVGTLRWPELQVLQVVNGDEGRILANFSRYKRISSGFGTRYWDRVEGRILKNIPGDGTRIIFLSGLDLKTSSMTSQSLFQRMLCLLSKERVHTRLLLEVVKLCSRSARSSTPNYYSLNWKNTNGPEAVNPNSPKRNGKKWRH